MRRRTFLRTVGITAGLGSIGTASAHPTETGTTPGTPGSDTPGSETPGSETPTGPDPLGTLPLEGAKEAVVRDETTVFLATTDGFAIVDVSDPADPNLTYRTDAVLDDHEQGPLRGIWDVTVDGDRLLVVGPAYDGFDSVHAAVVFDVADPAAPERVAVHETEYPIHNAFLVDDVAYITGNDFETNAIVTVDAPAGEELGRWSLVDYDDAWEDVEPVLRTIHDVWVSDEFAYLAHWDAGTWILDVSDPASPEVVSRMRGRPVEGLAAVEEALREATELPGNDHFVTVDDAGTLLGVGVESWAAEDDSDSGPGGISFYDISDPQKPRELSHISPPPSPDRTRGGVWTTAHNFELVGDRCYSSWYQGGVKVHDVSDPASPREIFHWRDADRAKFWTAQLGVPGDFFVASSWEIPGEEGGPGGIFTFPDPERSPSTSPSTNTSAVDPTRDDSTLLIGLGALAGAALGALGFGAWRARR